MTTEQMNKSAWLNRLYYLKLKLNSLYSLRESDKKNAQSLIEMIPCKDTQLLQECRKIIEDSFRATEEKYVKLLNMYNITRHEIETAIEKIEDFELQTILIAHYLEHKPWNIIAKENYYGLRTVKYKHLKALDLVNIHQGGCNYE